MTSNSDLREMFEIKIYIIKAGTVFYIGLRVSFCHTKYKVNRKQIKVICEPYITCLRSQWYDFFGSFIQKNFILCQIVSPGTDCLNYCALYQVNMYVSNQIRCIPMVFPFHYFY